MIMENAPIAPSPFFKLSLELRRNVYRRIHQPCVLPCEIETFDTCTGSVSVMPWIRARSTSRIPFRIDTSTVPEMRLVSRKFKDEYEDETFEHAALDCHIAEYRPWMLYRLQDSWFTRKYLEKIKEVHFAIEGGAESEYRACAF